MKRDTSENDALSYDEAALVPLTGNFVHLFDYAAQ